MNMDVLYANVQSASEMARKDLKRIESRGVSKAETLEDIRDTRGKSFRTADIEKLMEKYDPEAYAEYSKFAKNAEGGRTQGGLSYLSNWMNKVQKGFKEEAAASGTTSSISSGNESKLSSKAQDFLKNLRKQYGDYDFLVGNSTDDLKSLVRSGTKEFSIIFSNAELERMADDENYAKEKLAAMEQAVKMSERINEQYGFGADGESGVKVNRIGVAFREDGTTTFFAEMEKSSAKQREMIEKNREERRAEKKDEERKAKKEVLNYSKNSADTKHTTVQADSMEELLEKISQTEWDNIKAEKMPESGTRYDFSI